MGFTIALYLLCGAISGIMAGLLGVGGGIIIVPMLNYAFMLEGIEQDNIQIMAVATSLACILFTSISSVRAHHRLGSVNWSVWKIIAPGVFMGTFCGTFLAALLPQNVLRTIFIVYLVFCAIKMLFPLKVKSGGHLPPKPLIISVGGIIGIISSLVGIGGGTMSVPFLGWASLDFRSCVGTSAAIGFPIALAGSLGYIVGGSNTAGLPAYALGYIYLPACFGVVVASIIFASLGAKIAHRISAEKLRRVFAIFLLIVACDMVWNMF